jgi:hypothetical protein
MEVTSVKGYISRDLRRRAFAQFALRDMSFSGWLRVHLSRWLEEVGELGVGTGTTQPARQADSHEVGGSRSGSPTGSSTP